MECFDSNPPLDLWKQIQKEMSYRVKLDNGIINGDEDVTELRNWKKRNGKNRSGL
jgi:hypothetical protein